MAAPQHWMAVALSGGRDSMALLEAAVRASAPFGVGVLALHVHHGLLPGADAWLAHCEAHCAARAARGEAVRFAACRLRGRPPRGESVEAWARAARYAALASLARRHGCDLVLLAHHRRDQAETLLLQALRGAGVAGLAGMPRTVKRDGVVFARPWLDAPRSLIEAYARKADLDWVDDGSNDDPRFARSRLRRLVWPTLLDAFDDAESTLAASARRAAQAAALCDEVGALDLAAVRAGDALAVSRWLELSLARRANALRLWLPAASGVVATATLLERLLAELPATRSARWPAGAKELRLHRGRLRAVDRTPASAGRGEPDGTGASLREATLSIRRAGLYRLPGWGGSLRATRARSGGIAIGLLASVELRSRRGGERFQAGAGRPPRSLKKQYQAVGVAGWDRGGPLVWSADRLLYVPGLGIDHRAVAEPGEPQLALHWLSDGHPGATAAGMLRRNR